MDEKTNEKLAKVKNTVVNNVSHTTKNNNLTHYRNNDKIRWTELRLKYLDSLLQINIEKSNINVDEDINKLINKLNESLIDEK
ncbi:hypothetical protein [Sporolactobacillus putidus]|uniref:Uncharacterized protein n=1 Tax=Sporolactobacillus putidus TaxID=492735 RepID=A0A917S3U2_9BACL|nr:hypothetical protein [Sporolactobacillus putidus]GGL55777.1 hypothetical protein GCM10007968_19840 [Sporolactobacillus putidus]